MSKNDVIKPGHFKLRGRFRPSDDGGLTTMRKESFSEEKSEEAKAVGKPEPAAQARKKSRV